jgi:hypothetical protein
MMPAMSSASSSVGLEISSLKAGVWTKAAT